MPRGVYDHSKIMKHGHSRKKTGWSPTYRCWQAMIQRCSRGLYNNAGIRVCDRWLHSFENFLTDMGERPDGATLDRYPNQIGDYSPDNCRWATYSQQQNNRRDNVVLELNGVRKTVTEWSRLLGIAKRTIDGRHRFGWSDEEALLTRPWARYKMVNRKRRS